MCPVIGWWQGNSGGIRTEVIDICVGYFGVGFSGRLITPKEIFVGNDTHTSTLGSNLNFSGSGLMGRQMNLMGRASLSENRCEPIEHITKKGK